MSATFLINPDSRFEKEIKDLVFLMVKTERMGLGKVLLGAIIFLQRRSNRIATGVGQ
jgi:hypothetical protein